MRFILGYVQPRPASYDRKVAIYEKKEYVFEAETEADAVHAIDLFLTEGPVVCGENIYRRQMASLSPCPPAPQVLEPRPEFLPVDEYL
ncbi:hypothetical protein KGQ25_02820 [Patescibacteria group bacterium]|nr:hypothetical protein [Patescibacteria group bacterium]MDE2173552.1 hypothetical protein [Patescibacteria group bacterium]